MPRSGREPELDLRARQNRDIRLEVRVSEVERAAIVRAAADSGLTVSDYVREAVRLRILQQGRRRS